MINYNLIIQFVNLMLISHLIYFGIHFEFQSYELVLFY